MERKLVEANMRYLVIELFWASIYIGAISFNAAYLIRLGGSNLLVSLLTSGAALINALMALPSALFFERRARRMPWIVGSLAAARLCFLGMIAVPWLPAAWQPGAMLTIFMLFNIPAGFFTVGWLPLLADLIPRERRARMIAARNLTLGVVSTITTLVLGAWLDAAPFPRNYQLLYAVGVVTALISTLYVARMVVPDSPIVPPAPRLGWAGLRAVLAQQRPFTNIVLNTLVFNIALWMATPLQPIYFVRTLNASDGWLGLWLGMISGGAILGNLIWSRLIARRGPAWALPRATVLSAAYYLLIAAFPNLSLILLCALLWGCISPGVDMSHFQTLLEASPSARRATYLGVFTLVMNLGFFLTPLAVAPLVDMVGPRALLVALGLLRLAGGLLFVVNPVLTTTAEPARAP